MPWEPATPPLLADDQANELGRWAFQQMQQLAAALEAPDVVAHNVLHVVPDKPREGQIVVADGTDWDPGDGAGQYMYIGGAWVIQRAGPEPNTYGIITDGTTPAPAEIAGDTFKLRADTGLKVVTQNDDATHGDNALFSLMFGDLTSTVPALDDKVPFGDTSASDAPKRATPQTLLDLIGSLSTDAAPDVAADFVATYDASATVAKKVALSKVGAKVLISTTSLSGTLVSITVPAGYKDVELIIKGLSTSAITIPGVLFSEDNGASFVTQITSIFNATTTVTTSGDLTIASLATSDTVFANIVLKDYLGSGDKLTNEFGIIVGTTNRWGGIRKLTSTAAINRIRFDASGGTGFDAGSVELWGIP